MRLYVNIDHVATVREARRTDEPDPVRAAILAEAGGAEGITVHLREDRRHIQDRDLRVLMEVVRTGVNLEVAAEKEVVEIAIQARPMQVTLVPEHRQEVTTEGGLDLSSPNTFQRVREASDRLREAGIRVSLFVDPEPEAVEASLRVGAEAVEFHTGEYANARGEAKGRELARLHRAVREGRDGGLGVHAGHGLTYENILPVAALPELEEVNIGHSIISRAILVGMERAVRDMRALLREAPARISEPGTWVPPLGY
ncbi:MAG: pyridoxine 5'-phosphate synthase [Gemmatimonadales bacterium]|jgi:pyridoxine 5-phosphate synthase|nr:MAG: pyridoxine 5'-phosphate synthase [Gemmatimonadales bacterium]